MSAPQRYFLFLGVLAAVTVALSLGFDWPLGIVALVLFVGWPVIGTLVTLDDDMPGGWSNPDGRAIPEWRTLRWNLEILLCRGSIVVACFAAENHAAPKIALSLFVVAALMALVGFPYVLRHLRAQQSPSPTTVTNS